MKSPLVVFSAALVGVVAGLATATLKTGSTPWRSVYPETVRSSDAGGPGEASPRVAVDRMEYDFGHMDITLSGSHDFTFTNTGDATLELEPGGTTCRCTLSEIAQPRVPPGGSTTVTITWKADEEPGAYQQTATILTNDPRRPQVKLTITGRITRVLQSVPAELTLSRLSSRETATAEVKLLCFRDEPLQVTGCEVLNPDGAEHFEVTASPLPEGQLDRDAGVLSGQLIRVTVKPGLPQGAFRQKIRVRTNLSEVPSLEIPIQGMVGSDIAVVGAGWNPDTGILDLGVVPSQKGARRRLLLVVHGPDHADVRFTPTRIVPGFLGVELREQDRRQTSDGKSTQIPLIIQIPEGVGPANHLGSEQGDLGQVFLDTTSADTPQLRIYVRFAVEGGAVVRRPPSSASP